MPDISMCDGGDCPVKDTCYRHTAFPSPWRQSYFMNPPMDSNTGCVYFWKDDRTKEQIEKERKYYEEGCASRDNYLARQCTTDSHNPRIK